METLFTLWSVHSILASFLFPKRMSEAAHIRKAYHVLQKGNCLSTLEVKNCLYMLACDNPSTAGFRGTST